MGNIAGAMIIGADGNVKVLQEGENPQPGDVILLPDGTFTEAGAPVVNAAIAQEDGSLRDVTDDVQQIIAALEDGQDPTQVDEEFDPAAGEESGSSGTSLDSVQRTGDEAIAQTNFETQGFEGIGLSRTQSLGLVDRILSFFETAAPDTPPQAQDFNVSLDANGRAAIVFNDDVEPSNDNISDAEDDPANTPLSVVITSLPESGILLYDGEPLTVDDLTQFDENGNAIGDLKTFDPDLFTYQNDNESTGFILGVKEEPEGLEGGRSTTSFLNWGEPVDGDPTQRVLSFEGSDDVITISAISDNDQALSQYFGDKNHVGYGLGVGGGNGIQEGETISIDMSQRPSDSVTLGLDGMGGYFNPDHPTNPTSVLITVYLDEGGPIVKEITKDTTGNSELFKEIEIFASEGQEGASIIGVDVSTIGNGNWELRYFEANPAEDTFDYRAVDSDNNVSEESTVSLVEAENTPPIATDDPVGFEVSLGQFNGDDWTNPDAQVSGSYQGDDKDITESGVKRGVAGDENGGPGAQIQYNREEGESEQFTIDLDKPVTEFTFSVSNLFQNEGGSGNHEQGKWVAYFGDNAVASGMFVANEGNSNGTYSFDETALGGVAFDRIVFESVDFVNEPSRGSDSSDYFLTGFKASSDGAYVANQGEVLQIPVSELLGNDADPDGDNIRFTHVSDANNANIWIEDGIVYIDLDDNFTGDTHFDYVITDDKGGFDEAKVSIIVNPLPTPVDVDSIEMLDTTVVEGDNLVYQVALEDGVLEETRYSIEFGANDDTATDNDVDLSQAQFTNGVTFDPITNEIVVPIGISNFSIVIPTLVDGIYELTEDYTLTVGGVSGEGNIENVDIPLVQVSDDVDVSEGQDAVFTVSLSTPTEAPTTINLGINHISTESDDIGAMLVEFEGNNGWEVLTVANNGDVVLPAGVNEVRVTVATTDDNNAPIYEGAESFELTASGVVGAQGNDKGVATIFDDGSVDPSGPTPADDDRPVVTSVSEPTVEEGNIATFDVTLSSSSTTSTAITLTLSEGSASDPDDFNGSQVTVKFGATTQVLPVANDGTVQFDLPAGESEFEVLVQTNDDVIVDNNETFNLAATTEYQQSDVDGDATITDDVDPAIVTLTGPESVMEGDSTGQFTITLSDPAKPLATPLAPAGSIITLSYSYVNADGDDIVEVAQAIVNPDGYTANFTIDTVQDDVYEEGQAFTVSVVSVTDDQNNNIFEALDLSDASQHVLIDDSKDNPPEAEDFDVALDSNGSAAIVFNDDVNADNDHISDQEDDSANTPLGVVITSLPESGVLFYDGQPLDESDLTQFDDNGEVIGELKTFDPTLFTYENDDQSTGFFLGVKEEPEGFEGDESTTSFLNWGEPVDGDPTQRVLTFEGSDDVIRITAESNNDQPLTQYFGDKNHIGYGLGVGNGDGIQANESIVIDMSERPADSVTLGLDGLGGWFYEGQQANPTSVLITVYLDDGSTIVKEVTKETSGNTDLFKEIEIFASEGQEGAQITSVEVSTIGNGNWELRYFEANPADDSFDYRAVDSDDNVSEERTVSLVEADNTPPIATDDPVAFEVELGKFNGDDWIHPDAQVSGSYQGDDKGITESGVKRGVEGDENGGPDAQIQYNREEGESEQFRIDLDEPVTEFTFSVSNLFKDEGGNGNHEQGKWVAYFGDNAVASGLFIANEGSSNGTYSFDETALGGVAFDSIVFEAVDFVNEPSRGSDSSDYFLTGFKASSDGAYVANQGDVLQIPVSELLGNDADPDGDSIRFTHVSDANNANIWIEDGIVYIDLDDDFTGDTHFDYVITDDKGGFDEAKVSIIVNPLPTPVDVDSIEMLDTTVVEGDNLVYQVALEDGVLEETRYSIEFGANDDTATDNDVDLSQAQFTNGVTFDPITNEIVVPIGISNFSIVIPTLVDGIYELTEDYTLSIGGVSGEGNIENVDIPLVQVSDDVDVSEGQDAVFIVSLTTPTEAPTTINLGINHISTESDDIGAMLVEFEGNNGSEVLTVANNGDVVLPAGVNEVRVTVATTDDNNAPIYEGAESFELTASGVVGAQGNDKGVATIFDDGSVDPSGPTPADDDRPVVTGVSEPTVEEGNIATFDVTLSSSSTTDTTITLTLAEGNATTPEDFDGTELSVQFGSTTQVLSVGNDGTVQFILPAGESEFDVLVQTTDDNVSDNNEVFMLSASTQYQQGVEEGLATITDNESPTLDLDGSQYQIEFVSESAGYQNVFGYYVYDDTSDTQQLMILMDDSHDYKGNVVDPVLGQLDSLDNVGYFLIPDAADVISSAPANAEFTTSDMGELLINGAVVPNQTVFSTHGENSTIRVSEDNDGNTVLSFDDQLGHPRDDDDYNDLVIKVSKLDSNVDYQTTFTEGDDPVSIADLDADIFDDHDRITTMEVTLVNKFDGDSLTLPANTSGFTIGQSVLASSIVLTVTADDPNGLSASEFEAFLKQIGFENSSENPDETDRTVTVKVTDDAGQESNTATTTVQVIEVSDLDVDDSAAGQEDTAIALDITLPADSSVVEIVIKDIPDGAVLASDGNEISVINGMASLSPNQLDLLTITPPEHSDVNFSLRVEGYTANDTVIEDHIIDVDVEAVTDTPNLDIEGAEILSFHNFDTIDLDGQSWRGNIDSQELTDADVVEGISDGAEGVWGTDNNSGNQDYNEVGKETVYRGNAGEQGNNVYELEGRNGDDQLFTQFEGEAGQFYALSFDVAARRLDDSPMTIFLENSQGERTILFEYTDQQSLTWSSETLNFQTPDDGQYKVVFESETSANSYGALLDDIKLGTLDNVGYEDSYIALSDIVVGLVDTDGSETLTTELDLGAFPAGTVIKAPDGSDLTPDGSGKIDITAWQNDLSELFINVPEPGNYPLGVSVSSQDNAPGVVETVDKVINVTVLPVLDAQSKQIEIIEDSEHILTLNDLGITDPDATLFVTQLSSNGQYELQTAPDTWEPIAERDRIDGSEIAAGNVRFVPAEHETGYDQYPNVGEGNQYQDYSSLGFILEKGDARSEENTLTIDVSPVADAPTLSIVTPDIVFPEQSFNISEWDNVVVDPIFGLGNGVDGDTLVEQISMLDMTQATQSTTNNAQETGSGATPANTAVLVTGLVYLEAGNTYDFTGKADDSLAIKVGGELVDEARWGVNSGQINGSEFIPPVSGFYPIEIYHHNQSGPGNFDVNVSINGAPAVDLASSNLPVVPDQAALENTELRTSALQIVEGVEVYEVYAYNEGLQDTEIPLSEITTALVDTDNSEDLMVELSGLPQDATLSDGAGNSVNVDASGIVGVTGWDLTQLTVLPPLGDDSDFIITVTSTAKEQYSTSEADSVGTIQVVVHENKPTTTVSQTQTVDEDNSVSGNVLDSATDEDNVLSIAGFTLDNVNYNVGEAVNLASGTLLIEANGDYSFEPNADWSGSLPVITFTTNTGVSDTLTINITPVADEPSVSIVFGESTVNGQGDIETEVDIAASVNDLDGSEQIQSVVIQGLPATAVVSAGYQDGVNWILPVTGSAAETFDNLVITHPQGTVLDIDVTATSTEVANNDTATSTENAASQQDIYADQGGETPMTLMSLIIDSSGSMRSKPFYSDSGNPDQNKMRMELVLEASIEMLEHVNAQEGSENVLVQLIDFDDQLTDGKDGQSNDNADRSAQSEGWMTVNQAIAMLGSALSSVADSSYTGVFDPSGYTDYEEAVYGVMNGYDDAALNSVDLTNTNDVIFFLSDGSNNRGWDSTTNSEWDAFIADKEVTSVGVGVPSSIPKEGLEEVAGSGNILYIPDSKIKTELPKLRPTIGLPGTLLAMITGMDVEEIVINASSIQVLQEIGVNGQVTPASVTTRVDIDDLVVETDYGDLRIKEDGSYFFQPDPTAPQLGAGEAVGYNILYTVLDTNGVESQHLATLNISQSGDVKAASPSLNGSTGDDVITGTDGDDVLLGHQGDDVIDGGLGNDFLFGGDGDDVLIGGLGNDVLTGGAGNDTFLWMNSDLDGGLDIISDFTVSEDKIDISDLLGQNETMDDLFSSISATVVNDNNVELTITRDNGNSTQTIQLDGVVDQLSGIDSGSGNITGSELTNLLTELIKPQEI
ncbi:putative RTX toxin [Vibrio ichthyoenteri ATCC 700023]|uniref:Putative RTX toxin n=2 Tax=Vibrio ichthyoenteri TaxID=142461 RepID=F9S0D6_9VIBR|nr:putative RTX toxin [Vibrio ichthyoenteri ATCC 700023]